MERDFTCCVGTGMESHALHGDGIYYESPHKLWVNLYTPSTAEWKSEDTKIALETDFPEGESATLHILASKPRTFTIVLRRPSWAGQGVTIKVNGRAAPKLTDPGTYIEIAR